MMMFLLSLFGLVASGMLMAKYNEEYDQLKDTTKYKFNIFLLVFFILAVLGTIIAGAFGMKSSSTTVVPATIPQASIPAQNAPKTNASAGKPITATVGDFVPR